MGPGPAPAGLARRWGPARPAWPCLACRLGPALASARMVERTGPRPRAASDAGAARGGGKKGAANPGARCAAVVCPPSPPPPAPSRGSRPCACRLARAGERRGASLLAFRAAPAPVFIRPPAPVRMRPHACNASRRGEGGWAERRATLCAALCSRRIGGLRVGMRVACGRRLYFLLALCDGDHWLVWMAFSQGESAMNFI
jgi:hypothetical protein